MGLSKVMKVDNQWKRVSLTPEEMQQVLENLIEFNASEFKRCLDVAEKIDKKDKFNIATVLFDKQGLASFTAMTEALEEKVNAIRDKTYGKQEAEFEKELKNKEPPKPPEPEARPMETKQATTSEQLNTIKEQVEEPPKQEATKPEIQTPQIQEQPQPEQKPESVDIPEKNGVTVEERIIETERDSREQQENIESSKKKESPEEVGEDVFGQAWNPEKGKFEYGKTEGESK